MDCIICYTNEINEDNKFHCFGCKLTCCTTCMQTYLMGCSSDPHCLNCRAIVPYDQYVKTFDKKWRLKKYKKHKENILWEKEQSLIPVTVQKIAKMKDEIILNKKKKELYAKINELEKELGEVRRFIYSKDNNKLSEKFKYTHRCINDGCKGFLNDKFICDLCDIKVCNKCFIEKGEEHECDPELVETCKLIKNEAKPCPSCGEFISKISGCDQMFCTMCGTAFSWKTGTIEKGIIHNPHAHTFFQNNPDALHNYNNNNNNNNCRGHIPQHHLIAKFQQILPPNKWGKLKNIHRHISEFRQYYRNNYINFINNNIDDNEDIRYKLLRNEIAEKHFKSMLHARSKKASFKKTIYEILVSTTEIVENFLWAIVDAEQKEEFHPDDIDKIMKFIEELRCDTNNIIMNVANEHNYTGSYVIREDFYIRGVV